MTLDARDHFLPWLVAHRGAMAEAPENTEHAFDAALRYPIDGIEFDVQLSKDDVPIVFHDDTIGRITGRAGDIGEYPYAILKEFDYGRWFSDRFAGATILSLEEMLRRYAGRTALLIELKTGSVLSRSDRKREKLVKRTLEVIDQAVSDEHRNGVFILSFDANALRSAHETAPDLKCILNLERTTGELSGGDVPCEIFRGFGLPLRKLTGSFSEKAHNAGKLVMTYACNTPDQVDTALQAGADFVLTDDPARVAPYFSDLIRPRSEKSK